MTNIPEGVVTQLCDEIDVALIGPLGDLLGEDLTDPLHQRLPVRARLLAALLCGDDDRAGAGVVRDILGALWPHGVTEHGWWRTPVGRLCARSLGTSDADAVTHSVAAAMLGVARGTVAQLVHRGTLDRHPDGGVTRASVLMRIGR